MLRRFKFIPVALCLLLGSGLDQTSFAKGAVHGGRGGGAMRNPVGHGASPARLLRGRGRGLGGNNEMSPEDKAEAEKAAYFDQRSHETPYPAAPRH